MHDNYERLKKIARRYWESQGKSLYRIESGDKERLVFLLSGHKGTVSYKGRGFWRIYDETGKKYVSFRIPKPPKGTANEADI